jgi:DNA-binding XRE family transcriptional regulator
LHFNKKEREMTNKKNRIKTLIVSKGYKQSWVAEQLGVTSTTLSLWAQNKVQPCADSLVKLMSLLDCKPEDIYERF